MSSAAVISLISIILTEAPNAVAAVRALLAKTDPTPADFDAAKAQIEKDTFEALAPNADALIKRNEPTAPTS